MLTNKIFNASALHHGLPLVMTMVHGEPFLTVALLHGSTTI